MNDETIDQTPEHSELEELTNLATNLASFELGLSGHETFLETTSGSGEILIPGCADLQMAAIKRIGHRGNFPMPKEWENLLSMLEPGQELLWIVTKRPNAGFSFHLALKNSGDSQTFPQATIEKRAAFRSVLGQFAKRSFPESQAEECDESKIVHLFDDILKNSNSEVVVTSGMPSPSLIEDGRDFAEQNEQATPDGSLNDIVEPFVGEQAFTIVFTVGRAAPEVANETLAGMTNFRTAISPFLKVQDGRNSSSTDTQSMGTQESHGESLGQTEARNNLAAFLQSLFGSHKTIVGHPGEKKGFLNKLWRKSCLGSALTTQQTYTRAETTTHTTAKQQGESRTTTSTNAMLELVDQKLQDSIRSLKKAAGTGAFFLGAEVFSPKTTLSLRLARSVSGCLSGAKTHLKPFQTLVIKGEGYSDHLLTTSTLDACYPAITLQSRHVAALFLPVPEADLPGLRTKRNVFYGKPNATSEEKTSAKANSDKVWLGDLSHLRSGFHPLDKHLNGSKHLAERAEFQIPAEDLSSHLLIAGTTGSGKTQRAAAILNNLPRDKFQVVVIESAKKTYRHLLRRENVNCKILALGASDSSALRINPFYFEPGTSLKRHISIFSDALADLLPVEALIGPKLRQAIQNCYLRYEWDIENGKYRGSDVTPVYPTMVDLHMEALALVQNLNYGPEVNSNYKGALLGRTRLFFDELYQDIFGWGGSVPLVDLFGEDDVILEMDALPPSEAKMPSFVLSLLLERMRSWQYDARQKKNHSRRDIVLVIEEAHNLLEKTMEGRQATGDMGSGGFLLKQIVRLLQEGREAGMGIMVVDQSPASLADAVIRNTNTKIILRISDSEEAERIGMTLGLTKEECRDLHELEDGEAVVKVKNAGKALKLCPAVLVAKIDPLVTSSNIALSFPDYYQTSKSIAAICRLFDAQPDSNTETKGLQLINELTVAAGPQQEARRFFAQKLTAIIAEQTSDKTQESPNHAPKKRVIHPKEIAELPLYLFNHLGCKSVSHLNAALYCLLSDVAWEDAAPTFDAACLPSLQGLEMHLSCNHHWIMGAASDLTGYLEALILRETPDESLKETYSQLRMLIRASSERIDSVKKLLLILNQ